MNGRHWVALAALTCLGIYLFVTAPPPLAEDKPETANIDVEQLFALLEAESDTVRALWTEDIVAAGTKAGLKFDEHWRDPDIEAGPLPALFLRGIAESLEKHPVPLSLFLGSDAPINDANRLTGQQLDRMRILRQTGEPQFFFAPDTGLHTGMFGDVAISEACITCHNEHEQTPKRDWRRDDVMGATTWMYPEGKVSMEELIQAISALHQGFDEAYRAYITKSGSFADPPAIGDRWPRDGYFLPSPEVFMREVRARTAPDTFRIVSSLAGRKSPTEVDAGRKP